MMIAIENSSQVIVLVVTSLFAAIAIFSVCLRFYARKVKGNPVEADDWCILIALVSKALKKQQWRIILTVN